MQKDRAVSREKSPSKQTREWIQMPKCYDCFGLSMHVRLIKQRKQTVAALQIQFHVAKRSLLLSPSLPLASFEFHYKYIYIRLSMPFLFNGQQTAIEMKWIRSAFLTVQ